MSSSGAPPAVINAIIDAVTVVIIIGEVTNTITVGVGTVVELIGARSRKESGDRTVIATVAITVATLKSV